MIMKRFTYIALMILLSATYLRAQDPEAMKKVEAAKIGVITERLGLTPEQAEQFWPIYREFSEKRRNILGEMRNARRDFNPQTATEEENRAMMDLNFQVKERELNLEKEYSEKLLRVISTRQLVSLRQAEDDFRRMVLEQLERRARQQNMRENLRERNQDRINGRRGN
jgi:hypothetical protein